MSKMFFAGILAAGAAGALIAPVAAQGATLGPAAHLCNRNATAVLVDVHGFKARTGTLRVQVYNADKSYLEKRKWLDRVDVPVTGSGAMQVCVPVKQPGNYVISVRHDLNGNGKSDRSDGGGLSGNPDMKVTDFIFKRKPKLGEVSFAVGGSTKRVPVTLNYVSGLSFEPVD
ncbi:DUF2141 domain-containing protein [Sphingopyxis indica]|uniref:Uncharacterized conserved protein, DUF2141 family n=1 Tax=Sphingopyxis indica TaxID=436663 RepID=A0A239GAG4_9SPHN|nr:DUF2141 domain-containing protein [Sphingopyxis indica]WOF44102.1 DUF2141 domain-containing protein [Sphingopyxis indica]SNS66326.1 Uncharacterized conserved protein, DUF2141 family [Sphingopyxis indica]